MRGPADGIEGMASKSSWEGEADSTFSFCQLCLSI